MIKVVGKVKVFFAILIITSCYQQSSTDDHEHLREEISSLRIELDSLKRNYRKSQPDSKIVQQFENYEEEDSTSTVVVQDVKSKKPADPLKKTDEKKGNPQTITDTIYYRYSDGRVSVKVCPFLAGERDILIFSPGAKLVHTLTDVRKSYSVGHDLKFRSNGSLELVKQRTNPGASRYWYECTITFGEQNNPLWKHCIQQPAESVLEALGKKYYWDKVGQEWKAQEIVYEQPVPQE